MPRIRVIPSHSSSAAVLTPRTCRNRFTPATLMLCVALCHQLMRFSCGATDVRPMLDAD